MARDRQNPEFEIVVDGEPYVWWLHGQPKWSRDPSASRGMTIAVRHLEGLREAIIEFPLGPLPRYGMPLMKGSQIAVKLVSSAIASAILAGWEPLSRGKPVNILVDATGA